jgi:type 2A phosphatase activator TIP41
MTLLVSERVLKLPLCYRYSRILELPHLPDMVFPNNSLQLMHTSGCNIEFNALDALKHVSNGKLAVKIACADAWKESR